MCGSRLYVNEAAPIANAAPGHPPARNGRSLWRFPFTNDVATLTEWVSYCLLSLVREAFSTISYMFRKCDFGLLFVGCCQAAKVRLKMPSDAGRP